MELWSLSTNAAGFKQKSVPDGKLVGATNLPVPKRFGSLSRTRAQRRTTITLLSKPLTLKASKLRTLRHMERESGEQHGHASVERADGVEVAPSSKRHSKIRKRSKRWESALAETAKFPSQKCQGVPQRSCVSVCPCRSANSYVRGVNLDTIRSNHSRSFGCVALFLGGLDRCVEVLAAHRRPRNEFCLWSLSLHISAGSVET